MRDLYPFPFSDSIKGPLLIGVHGKDSNEVTDCLVEWANGFCDEMHRVAFSSFTVIGGLYEGIPDSGTWENYDVIFLDRYIGSKGNHLLLEEELINTLGSTKGILFVSGKKLDGFHRMFCDVEIRVEDRCLHIEKDKTGKLVGACSGSAMSQVESQDEDHTGMIYNPFRDSWSFL